MRAVGCFRGKNLFISRIQRLSTTPKTNASPSMVKVIADLSKFRLSSQVVITCGAGFLCAGSPVDAYTLLAACVGTGLCAASASTFNQVVEIEADKKMNRTCQRPLPTGKITPSAAATWGAVSGIAGTGLLYTLTNPVVALLGLGNIALYAGAYTYSKRHTELNTWIGSIVGAIPPVMGWVAATGCSGLLAAEPAALGSLLFLWQFPHFFALSWLYREDYARGGFQMVAVNDPTGMRSANLIQEYSLYLAAFPIIVSMTGLTSYMFAIEGTAANLYLLSLTHKFKQDRTNANARRIFLTSLWYLPLLLAGFVFHSRSWQTKQIEETDAVDDQISETILHAKETMKGLCVHEMISEKNSAPQLCPKINLDKVTENASAIVQEKLPELIENVTTVPSQQVESQQSDHK